MTRHLSTIVEGREDKEELNEDECPFGRPVENRHRRLKRRVYSCGDITVSRDWSKEHDALILPPLSCPEKTHGQASISNGKATKETLKGCNYQNIFPDFRPADSNMSMVDLDAKVARHSVRSKLNTGGKFSHNKENILASWLQFFG